MNLYLISQHVNNELDTYDAAVVAAETEEEARHIHPRGNWDISEHTWVKPEDVDVFLIGTAEKEIHKGMILASFNAG